MYRFFTDRRGSHFYTANDTERDKLIDNFSNVWTFEGIAWYAYAPTAGVQLATSP